MVAEFGVTAIETRAAAVTVKPVEPETEPRVAVMVVVPVLALVANPVELMVATPAGEGDHVAVLVRSCVLPSEKVPVAVNCWIVPREMEGLAGLTLMEVNTAAPTVKSSVPVTEPKLAEMVTVPWDTACAKPLRPIVAIALLEELQVAVLVRL